MPTKHMLILFGVFLCYSSCERNSKEGVKSAEVDEISIEFSSKSDGEIERDLSDLRFVLRNMKDVSEHEFEGTQKQLDRILDDLRFTLNGESYEVAWNPKNTNQSGKLKGKVEVRMKPEHRRNCLKLIQELQAEKERRGQKVFEQAVPPKSDRAGG